MELPLALNSRRRLETLIENQTTYTLESAELSLFETHQTVHKVLLDFDQPVLASMITGKKVMRLSDREDFDFLPGESILLPAGEWMGIDFPEASLENPTKCLAMTISEEKIVEVIDWMNTHAPRLDGRCWTASDASLHFTNEVAVHQIIQRLLFLFAENHPSKDTFVDLMLHELLIRILQSENAHQLKQESTDTGTNNRIAFVLNYIRENITSKIGIKQLCKKACMSESHFYRVFKSELGLSPIEYINEERLKLAATLLRNPDKKVNEVYLECGFNSPSYFNRVFKRKHRVSPKEFQLRVVEIEEFEY